MFVVLVIVMLPSLSPLGSVARDAALTEMVMPSRLDPIRAAASLPCAVSASPRGFAHVP